MTTTASATTLLPPGWPLDFLAEMGEAHCYRICPSPPQLKQFFTKQNQIRKYMPPGHHKKFHTVKVFIANPYCTDGVEPFVADI